VESDFVQPEIGFFPRPGTTEMWLLKSTTPSTANGATTGVLEVFDGTETATHRFDLPSTSSAMGWIDDRELWVALNGIGLARVDAASLELGASFDAATLVLVPEVDSVSKIVVDTALGRAFTEGASPVDGSPAQFRVESDGTATMVADWRSPMQFVDHDGAVWFSNPHLFPALDPSPFDLHASGTADPAGAIASHFFAATRVNAVPNASTGGLWLSLENPESLARLDEDGTFSIVSAALPVGASTPVPIPRTVKLGASGDGRYLWTVSLEPTFQYDLDRYDMEQQPPVLEVVTSGDLAAGAQFGGFLAPMAPPKTSRTWIVSDPDQYQMHDVYVLDANGTVTPVFHFPGQVIAAFNSPASNRLCVATAEASSFALWRLAEDGTLEALGTEPFVTAAFFHQGGGMAQRQGAADVCWFTLDESYSNDPASTSVTLSAWSGPGVQLHHFEKSGAGNTMGIVPIGPDDVWLTLVSPTFFSAATGVRERVNFNGVSTATEIGVGGTSTDGYLVPPW
jgi:hypothetical protein